MAKNLCFNVCQYYKQNGNVPLVVYFGPKLLFNLQIQRHNNIVTWHSFSAWLVTQILRSAAEVLNNYHKFHAPVTSSLLSHHSFVWLRGATVARLTPDQKVACSNHVGVIFSSFTNWYVLMQKKTSNIAEQTQLFYWKTLWYPYVKQTLIHADYLHKGEFTQCICFLSVFLRFGSSWKRMPFSSQFLQVSISSLIRPFHYLVC